MLERLYRTDRHEASGKTGSYGRVWREVYTLDRFEAYKSTLTDEHWIWVERMVDSIANSIDSGAPFVTISLVGHAAFYRQNPSPRIPYATQAIDRARSVGSALRQRLMLRGLHNHVDITAPQGRSTSAPVAPNDTQTGRALNRRVVVTLEEIDPHRAPWRWVCRLDVDFGRDSVSVYNLKQKLGDGHGTGVLVSDRHVLTSAHNLLALRKGKGGALSWVRAKRIDVVPAMRGAAHTVQRPYGSWRAKPAKATPYPGFARPVGVTDYERNRKWPDADLRARLQARDLALLELEPRRRVPLGERRMPNGGTFGWWGRDVSFPLGFGVYGNFMQLLKSNPTDVRTVGYRTEWAHPIFTRGTVRRHGAGLYSRDMPLEAGQSGSPYWLDFGLSSHLVAVHKGNNVIYVIDRDPVPHRRRVPVEWGVMLSPAKVRWIRSVVGT